MAEKKDPNDIILGKKHEPMPAIDMKTDASSEEGADLSVRLHLLLTTQQVREAKEKARGRVDDERMKAALKTVEEEAYQQARLDAGFVMEGPAADIVQFTVNLPDPNINSCLGPINGQHVYWHGRTYPLPRHVANSLAEMQFRLWAYSAREIHGEKLREFYRRPHNTTIAGSGEVVSGTIPTIEIRG